MIESNLNIGALQQQTLKQVHNSSKNIPKEDEALRKVSNEFESFFMQQLLDISLKSTKFAGGGTGSEIIKGMYTEAISKQASGTMGISDMLYRFLSENNR